MAMQPAELGQCGQASLSLLGAWQGAKCTAREISFTIMVFNNLSLVFPYMSTYSIGIYVPWESGGQEWRAMQA